MLLGIIAGQITRPTYVLRAGDSRTKADASANHYGDRYYVLADLTSAGAAFVGRITFGDTDKVCEGYNGYYTHCLQGGQIGLNEKVLPALSLFQVDVIVMEIGYNDMHVLGKTAAVTAASHLKLMNEIFLARPNVRMIVLKIGPVNEAAAPTPSNATIQACNALVASNVATLAAAGKDVTLVDINTPLLAVPGFPTGVMAADGLHYLDGAYSVIASTYWPTLAAKIAAGQVTQLTDNLASGCSYSLSPSPHASYGDAGVLTNGAFFNKVFTGHEMSNAWNNADPTVALDLGSERTIGKVRVYFGGGDNANHIWPPDAVSVQTSVNGADYTERSTSTPYATDNGCVWDHHSFAPVAARYVKVVCTRHPAADTWTSIGEIEVRA